MASSGVSGSQTVESGVPVGTTAAPAAPAAPAATSAQEAKLVLVEFEALPQPAKEAGEKYVKDDERVAWELFGTTKGQRGGVVSGLGPKGAKIRFTLSTVGSTEGERHFIIAKSADKEKVEEVFSKVASYVPLSAEERAAAVRERVIGKMVFIPRVGIVQVFPDFGSRKKLGRGFKDRSVVFSESKDPFYFKRSREEEDVTLPDPATWVVLFQLQACRWFVHCCREFYDRYGELLGGVRLFSVLRAFAPRSGLPDLVYVAINKENKDFLKQKVSNPVLALCGYDVPQHLLDGETPVADIAKVFNHPSRDEHFDLDAAFATICESMEQRTIRDAAAATARRAAAAAVLAGTATANSFAALQEEDAGPSSEPPATHDPKEYPVLGAQAPQPRGVWAARGGNPQPSA